MATSYADLSRALLAQYAVLVTALATLDPAGPTDCEGWTLEDLETHIAITARGLARIASKDTPGPADGGGVAEWAAKLPAIAEQMDAGAKGERLKLADQVPLVEAALEQPGDKVVEQLTGRHTLRDATAFRLVEAVVHGLDAGVAPDRKALKVVVKELAEAVALRYPGMSVEVRIPPHAAVQCVAGPRHTRGTPPNVVETDGVSFVRLVAGRERWADLVADGRVRASGERSDLSGLLPLLG
ncbi:MAG: sterol carrier family protein [Mycobacteriales bacterium]